jgi:hypothetical protein
MLIPWFLAMNGDNPMQSEFSSHVGMSGTCLCRICHVKGANVTNRPAGERGQTERVDDFLKVSI